MTDKEEELKQRVLGHVAEARRNKLNLGGSDHMGESAAGGIVLATPEAIAQAQLVSDFLEGKVSSRGERLKD